jgi:hypothetical protein
LKQTYHFCIDFEPGSKHGIENALRHIAELLGVEQGAKSWRGLDKVVLVADQKIAQFARQAQDRDAGLSEEKREFGWFRYVECSGVVCIASLSTLTERHARAYYADTIWARGMSWESP